MSFGCSVARGVEPVTGVSFDVGRVGVGFYGLDKGLADYVYRVYRSEIFITPVENMERVPDPQ